MSYLFLEAQNHVAVQPAKEIVNRKSPRITRHGGKTKWPDVQGHCCFWGNWTGKIKKAVSAAPVPVQSKSVRTGNEGFYTFLFFFERKSEEEGSLMKKMTQSAQNILKQMREKDRRRRAIARLNDPRHRDRLLESFNKSTLDDGAAPIGNGQMTILKDIEDLDQEHDQYMENLRTSRLGLSGQGD
jgi:hypothetical protein